VAKKSNDTAIKAILFVITFVVFLRFAAIFGGLAALYFAMKAISKCK
jgi:hypothetical protein